MLKSFIQLNLQSKHDKSQYQIKKNKLILLRNKQLTFGNNNGQGIKAATSMLSKAYQSNSNQTEQTNKQIFFDCITYDYKSTNQKILYQLVMINTNIGDKSHSSTKTPIRMTITFNYDIEYEKLQELLIQMMQIKKFQSSKFEIAHFQLRSNHVSDYNKAHLHTNKIINKQSDQMDKFTKQIDTCIKLDKTYNIKENINFKQFTRENFKNKDILNKNSRTNYDKKTNEFFILNIDDEYEIYLIVFHRQKDYVLTKTEDKEIQEAFVLYKGENERGTVKLQFTTSLAQILQSFLNQSDMVIFVSQYPTINHAHTLNEQLHLPLLIDPSQPSSIADIIQQYNKQKESKLELQMQKMKVKLRQLKHKRKTTQQNISYLMKKYKKGFENIFDSLSYLKKNNIHDIKAYKDNLQIQIKQRQQEIKDTLEQLKEINLDMIQSSQRNEYFMHKMEYLKENLQQDLQDIEINYNTKRKQNLNNKKYFQKTTQNSAKDSKNNTKNDSFQKQTKKQRSNKKSNSRSPSPQTMNITESILKKFLQVEQASQNPFQVQMKRQVEKYTNQLREKTRQRLIKSQQVDQFHNIMDQLRKRLSKHEFTKLEQKYLALISMC